MQEKGLQQLVPPCARYEGGEGEGRISLIFPYAMGLLGGCDAAKRAAASVARLYDYKGCLYVALRGPMLEDARWAFRRAWNEMGYEPEENVEFVDVTSSDWEAVWKSRRFESDWTP